MIPPPFKFLSCLYLLKPSIQNCVVGNEESILVSDNSKISTLSFTISFRESNLLVKELMLSCATMDLLEIFLRTYFRTVTGSKKVSDESDTWLVSDLSVDKTDISISDIFHIQIQSYYYHQKANNLILTNS